MREPEQSESFLKPFVRYKHYVDSTVVSAVETMFGPTGFHPRHAGSSDSQTTPLPLGQQIRSLLWSEYHPYRLRHLPQPVPNDLPQGAEPIFTFEDAFEDLLAVSQGQQMPEIRDKYSQRKLLNQVFPKGEPPMFWRRRLESQGLLPSLRESVNEEDHLKLERPRPPEDKSPEWDRLHSEVARRREETWGAEARNGERPGETISIADLMKFGIGIIESSPEIKKTFEDIHRKVEEEIRRVQAESAAWEGGRSAERGSEQPTNDDGERKHPKTFDEWFDQVQSLQTTSSSSWDAFKKTLDLGREAIHILTEDPERAKREMKQVDADNDKKPPRSAPDSSTRWTRAGGATMFEERREVDENGHITTRSRWRKFDEKGNEIDGGEDIQVDSIAQRSQNGDNAASGRMSGYERGFPADSGEVKKPGWFWK